jgi:hypothetical protein
VEAWARVGDIELVTWDAIAFAHRDESRHHRLNETATFLLGLHDHLL